MKKRRKMQLSIIVLLGVATLGVLSTSEKKEIPVPYENAVAQDGLKVEYTIDQDEDGYVLIKATITNTTDKRMVWPEHSSGELISIGIKTENDIGTTLKLELKELLRELKDEEKPKSQFMVVATRPIIQAGETEFFEREDLLKVLNKDGNKDEPFKLYEGGVEYIISNPEFKIILKGEIENKKLILYEEKIETSNKD